MARLGAHFSSDDGESSEVIGRILVKDVEAPGEGRDKDVTRGRIIAGGVHAIGNGKRLDDLAAIRAKDVEHSGCGER